MLVQHNGKFFKEINALEFVFSNCENSFLASKATNVTARQGKVGEVLVTKMKNGFIETENVVSFDAVTGEPDWIVTQVNGEQMIVSDESYKQLYETDGNANLLKPTGKIRPVIEVKEDVCFMAPWGEMQFLEKGGFIITLAKNNIYGIQKQEFFDMYNMVEGNGKELIIKNLQEKHNLNKPKIFLSVAYPHTNELEMKFLKQIIVYINSKGVSTVNIKKINESNVNIIKEITNCLSGCNGIVSLAFARNGNHTSPWIHIENSLAFSCNIPSLTIIPKEVEQDGVLYVDNLTNETYVFKNTDLYSEENLQLRNQIDSLVEKVLLLSKNTINDKELSNFKALIKEDRESASKTITNFLKKRYSIKEEEFTIEQVYIKRPVEVKAVYVKSDGYYITKNGREYLQKGDYLVTDVDDKVYSVSQKKFEETYVKVNGKEDVYVKKLIPVILTKKQDGNSYIKPMHDLDDEYIPDRESFRQNYCRLEDYILSLSENLNQYENDLSEFNF